AEMKAPGAAKLTLEVEPAASSEPGPRSVIVMTARFRPRGLAGIAYWYSVKPLHHLVFRGMLAGLARQAERESRENAAVAGGHRRRALPPTGPIEKVNLAAAMASFAEAWSPRIIADVNECQVKLARLQGPFVWHHHDDEDELFLVIKGSLRMLIRDRGEGSAGGDRDDGGSDGEREVRLEEGECIRIPRG